MPEQATTSTPEHIHESFDTNIRPIVMTVVILFAGIGVCMALLYIGLLVMKHRSEATDTPPNPVELAAPIPPEPRLQPSPPHQTLDSQDLIAMRAAENHRLTTYGRDPKTGDAHIPISRAMELLLQQQSQQPESKQPGAVGAAQ